MIRAILLRCPTGPEIFLCGGICMAKEYCKGNDQIRKLKSRGMIIENYTKAKRLLEYSNYFVVVNGYKDLFIDQTYTGPDERYKKGTTFSEVYALYLFDRKIRTLFLQNILALRTPLRVFCRGFFLKNMAMITILR